MGNSQSGRGNWNVDEVAFGTAKNAVTIDEVVTEVGKIPTKYFGGAAIENDATMHQLQNSFLSFDESIKKLFRRKKSKESQDDVASPDEYYYEDQEPMPFGESPDLVDDQGYLRPTFLDKNKSSSSTPIPAEWMNERFQNTNKIIWRCTSCTAENKITEHSCRRCGLAETKL